MWWALCWCNTRRASERYTRRAVCSSTLEFTTTATATTQACLHSVLVTRVRYPACGPQVMSRWFFCQLWQRAKASLARLSLRTSRPKRSFFSSKETFSGTNGDTTSLYLLSSCTWSSLLWPAPLARTSKSKSTVDSSPPCPRRTCKITSSIAPFARAIAATIECQQCRAALRGQRTLQHVTLLRVCITRFY